MTELTAVLGDLTQRPVDAIVNAASTRMRGGGGVDGAIHRAGGPAILEDCIRRFPHGLATGDAGWTTAGAMPARWVIHTVGPNYGAGERDRELLVSCYRRSLEVADELGARSVAFPLVSAGVYAWPRDDAIAAAIDTLASAPTRVERVELVVLAQEIFDAVRRRLASRTPFLILEGAGLLIARGCGLRLEPMMNPSGTSWRVVLSPSGGGEPLRYTTADLTSAGGGELTVASTAEDAAELIRRALPSMRGGDAHPEYARWYAGLLEAVTRANALPIAQADRFDDTSGWEIGWGSGVRYPRPPAEG